MYNKGNKMATVTKKQPIAKTITPPRAKKVAKAIKLTNEVAVVLDASGSMQHLSRTVIKVTNSWLDKIEAESNEKKQISNITKIVFSNNAHLESFSQSVNSTARLNSFPCGGGTALFDGVCLAIDKLEQFEKNKDTSMLVIIVTDGEENQSSHNNVSRIGKLILDKQKTDRWSFVFMLPPGQKSYFCSRYNIPTDNVTEWEATEKGLQAVEERTSEGLVNYFSARSRGLTSSNSFYSQTDLSAVTPKEVKKTLTNIASQCQVFEVPKETDIASFVTLKTKVPYKTGKSYYQLTKKETVQPTKDVLIMEKGKSAIYGGEEAREMIGLHNGATDKVTPGNHANYDIFIKSTSHNRILVRGTKLIVRN